jgi:hypothetical protein
MHPTYYLKPSGVNGNQGFYNRLSDFTTRWIEIEIPDKRRLIDSFINFTVEFENRIIRTPEEAYIEFLALGIYLCNYSETAARIVFATPRILGKLYTIRNIFPTLKHFIDRTRGILSYLLLRKKVNPSNLSPSDLIGNLLSWLDATGEFQQEIDRLRDWKRYVDRISPAESTLFIQSAKQSAKEFSDFAKENLGGFTSNVEVFLKEQPVVYRFRENFFFTARKENEYFLNMFGAEIINRAERAKFMKTTNKLLLLPTCMRQLSSEKCKAVFDGKGMLCQGCNSTCNIHQTAGSVGYKGVKTYIIHHSSMFSQNLKYLTDAKDTGIIGVACALNLLAGGYELKKKNIPAQCVYLDYSGCKKHWHLKDEHQPTSIQIKRLVELVG